MQEASICRGGTDNTSHGSDSPGAFVCLPNGVTNGMRRGPGGRAFLSIKKRLPSITESSV